MDSTVRRVVLRDGAPVTLRAIRPADEPALTALYERLSPRSAYQRFFAVMRRLHLPELIVTVRSILDGVTAELLERGA